MKYNIVYLFFILILIASCQSDKHSTLISKYLKENYSICTKHQDISILIFKESGCYSCNTKLEVYLDTVHDFKFDYLILASKYPQKLENKYREKFESKLLIDKTDQLSRMNIGFHGSGKIIVKYGKLTKVEQYVPTQDSITFFMVD
ncbi:MAG: hypothetical protein R6V52_02185 [Bacteroidales bacterium]